MPRELCPDDDRKGGNAMVGIGKVNAPIQPCTRAMFYEAVQSKFVQDTCDMIKRLQQKAKDEPMKAE